MIGWFASRSKWRVTVIIEPLIEDSRQTHVMIITAPRRELAIAKAMRIIAKDREFVWRKAEIEIAPDY